MTYNKLNAENNELVRKADFCMKEGMLINKIPYALSTQFSIPEDIVSKTLSDNGYNFSKVNDFFYSAEDYSASELPNSYKELMLGYDINFGMGQSFVNGFMASIGAALASVLIATLAKNGLSIANAKLAAVNAVNKNKNTNAQNINSIVAEACDDIERNTGLHIDADKRSKILAEVYARNNTNFSLDTSKLKLVSATALGAMLLGIIAKFTYNKVKDKALLNGAEKFALEVIKDKSASEIKDKDIREVHKRYFDYLASHGVNSTDEDKKVTLSELYKLIGNAENGYIQFNQLDDAVNRFKGAFEASKSGKPQLAWKSNYKTNNNLGIAKANHIDSVNRKIDTMKKRTDHLMYGLGYKAKEIAASESDMSYQSALQDFLFADAQMVPANPQMPEVIQDPNQNPQPVNNNGQVDQPTVNVNSNPEGQVDPNSATPPVNNQPRSDSNSQVSNLGDPNANYLPGTRIVDDKGNHGTIRTGNKLLKDSKGEFTGVEVYWDSGKCDWISTQLIGMEVTPVQDNNQPQQVQQPVEQEQEQAPSDEQQQPEGQPTDQSGNQPEPQTEGQVQTQNMSLDDKLDYLFGNDRNFGVLGAIGSAVGGAAKMAGKAVGTVASTAVNGVKSLASSNTPSTSSTGTAKTVTSSEIDWTARLMDDSESNFSSINLNDYSLDTKSSAIFDAARNGVINGITKAIAEEVQLTSKELITLGKSIIARVTKGKLHDEELNKEARNQIKASLERMLTDQSKPVLSADKTIAARKNKLYLNTGY